MKTTVVNVKDVPRGTYVYIGRARRGEPGTFGNPCIVKQTCPICGVVHRFPTDTLRCYAQYLIEKMVDDRAFRAQVFALKGKKLGCSCKPKPCHGDILAMVIDEYDWTEFELGGSERVDSDDLYTAAIGDGSTYVPDKEEPWRCARCLWEGTLRRHPRLCPKCKSTDVFPCNDGGWNKGQLVE